MTEDEKCRNCKYYMWIFNTNTGHCTRYPPTVIYDSKDDKYESVFPVTKDNHLCGEYKE